MEVVSVGIMHYAALVPCVVASYVAYSVAYSFGLTGERFALAALPEFNLLNGGKILLLGLCCAAVSILFCVALHKTEELFAEKLQNAYLRAVGFRLPADYLNAAPWNDGLSGNRNAGCRAGSSGRKGLLGSLPFEILFTAVTLSGGIQGRGDCALLLCGSYLRLASWATVSHLAFPCGGCGMAAVFCGVTNSPISSPAHQPGDVRLRGRAFFFLAIAVSYMQSGYYGLYRSQKIMYSKVKTRYINRNAKE